MTKKQQKRAPGFLHSRIISIVSISMVLFLIGVVTAMGLAGRELQDFVRSNISFSVELQEDADPVAIDAMRKRVEHEPFAKEVILHSKEEALREITAELGEDPEEFLGWNPLSPVLQVKTKPEYIASPDSVAMVEKILGAYTLTKSVSFKKGLADSLNQNLRTGGTVMIGVAFVLLLISIVLINNTIRLLIYSKRYTIYTMRLVGAKPGFIRRPFVANNVVSGFVASLLAIGLLAWLWFYIIGVYPYMRVIFSTASYAIVIGVVLLLGLLISLISSYLSVNKYLRMNVNKLYRV